MGLRALQCPLTIWDLSSLIIDNCGTLTLVKRFVYWNFYIAAQEENHSSSGLAEGLAFNVNGLSALVNSESLLLVQE